MDQFVARPEGIAASLSDGERQRLRAELDGLIQVGLDSLDRGEGIPIREAFERLSARLGLDPPDFSGLDAELGRNPGDA